MEELHLGTDGLRHLVLDVCRTIPGCLDDKQRLQQMLHGLDLCIIELHVVDGEENQVASQASGETDAVPDAEVLELT